MRPLLNGGTLGGREMYVGPQIDDHEVLARLPEEYRRMLETVNGYVAYQGGLHVRGACTCPDWHSLRSAWFGDEAIRRLFPEVSSHDIPFAEDCLGDQFILRENGVWKLRGESGELAPLGLTLTEFDAEARRDPDAFLELGPLHRFLSEGGVLRPGQLLSVYPPFVFEEPANGVHIKAVANGDRRRFLAGLATQIRGLADGDLAKVVPGP